MSVNLLPPERNREAMDDELIATGARLATCIPEGMS